MMGILQLKCAKNISDRIGNYREEFQFYIYWAFQNYQKESKGKKTKRKEKGVVSFSIYQLQFS
jgi:hypothetical protein